MVWKQLALALLNPEKLSSAAIGIAPLVIPDTNTMEANLKSMQISVPTTPMALSPWMLARPFLAR